MTNSGCCYDSGACAQSNTHTYIHTKNTFTLKIKVHIIFSGLENKRVSAHNKVIIMITTYLAAITMTHHPPDYHNALSVSTRLVKDTLRAS